MPTTPLTGDSTEAESIGAVLDVLRSEFPDVSLSKIRFLEAEGLVRPERMPSGHRKFRSADVQRLRRVLRMQRDDCLSLRAIRERLDGDGDPVPSAGSRAGGIQPVRARRDHFFAATGVDEVSCAEWEAYGLVRSHGADGYDVGQVPTARLLAELGRHGLQARHLRAVKAASGHAAYLVGQVVAPLRVNRDRRTREQAEATARRLAQLTTGLYEAYLREALDESRVPEHRNTGRANARAEAPPDYPNGSGTS